MADNDDTREAAALALAAECCRRISWLLHASGEYVHCLAPGGRACCYHRDSDIPEGSVPTEAQERFWGVTGARDG